MKLTTRKALHVLALIALLSTTETKAQEFADKFFFSSGFSVFTEAVVGRSLLPTEAYTPVDTNSYNYQYGYTTTYSPETNLCWSYFTYTANGRYNITEMDNNSSISVNVPLGIGLMSSNYGFGSINLPVYISYNSGNISTYSADQDKGFTVGLGFEYYNVALFKSSEYKDLKGGEDALDGASFVEPCLNLGYRYWNKANVAREFNLKVGFGPQATTIANGKEYDLGRALVFKLTWFSFSKY